MFLKMLKKFLNESVAGQNNKLLSNTIACMKEPSNFALLTNICKLFPFICKEEKAKKYTT